MLTRIKAAAAIVLFSAMVPTAFAQKTFETCQADREAALAEIDRPRPQIDYRKLIQTVRGDNIMDTCKQRVESGEIDRSEVRDCIAEGRAAARESYVAQKAEIDAIYATQTPEGSSGKRRKRLAREQAEKAYRNCIELIPYETRVGWPCDGIVRTETVSLPNGGTLERLMCYPRPKSVRETPRVWNFEEIDAISVAFNGGSDEMRHRIKAIAEDWAVGTVDPNNPQSGLRFDFGKEAGNGAFIFKEWSETDKTFAANIRISFDPNDGYWSMIGTQSDDPQLMRPGEASMNLAGMAKVSTLGEGWKGLVYHEFGHALGLKHEHQHPSTFCPLRLEDDKDYELTTDELGLLIADSQGRQAGVISKVTKGWPYWTEADARYNLTQLQQDGRLDVTEFDPNSVMRYEFDRSWYYPDAPPDCFPPGGISEIPSEIDRGMIRDTYRYQLQRKRE